jgi:hypothetical protein
MEIVAPRLAAMQHNVSLQNWGRCERFFLPACTCSVASCVHQTLFTAVVTSKRQTYLV